MTRGPGAVRLALLVLVVLAGCSDDGPADGAPPADDATATSLDVTAVPGDGEAGESELGSEGDGGGSEAPAPSGTPVEVVEHPGDWVLPGRDYDNSRATFDSPITAANVDELELVWEAEVGAQLSTVPLIVGDTVYVQSGDSAILAVDRETGEERWRSEAIGLNIGPFGAAVADGRVFGVHGSTGVRAVDALTGEELWVAEIIATPTTGIDIQPVVFDDTVFVSTVPVSTSGIYTGGDRGVIHALDAASGAVKWTFDTVDSDDVWGNPEVNSGGGAWYPPAIDPERGLVYWAVANPAPFPGTPEFPNATSRPGPNLYTNSIVALDLETGALEWFHQVIPHDLFDRDLVHAMRVGLADGSDIVVTTGKGATVVGVDPDSGEPQWETPVGFHQNDDLTELTGPTVVAPGTFGGVITPPAAADGVVYVATVNAPTELRPDETAYFGATPGQMDGEVVAIDAATGAVIWAQPVPGDPFGAVAVVNDLLLASLLDGRVVALERSTGRIVHEIAAPGGVNGWLAVADDLVVVPAGLGNPPRLLAYRLG